MSVDQIDVVDSIGIDKETGDVVLTISDHLEWSYKHLSTLQSKINCYLSFIESGEIYASYPFANGKKIVIDIVHKYPMDAQALSFFQRAEMALAEAGFELRRQYLSYQ